VQQLIREQADTLLREAELRAKTGLIGPSQVANAKTFMAEQELLLLDREEQLDKQSDVLASLMGVRPDEGARRFIPVDDPPKDFPVEDVDVLVQLALKNNLDLQASQQDIEAAEVQVSGAKWRVLPSVDLVGSIGGNGLAGSPQDVIFGSDTIRATRNGSFNDAISQSFKRDFPSWSVGVEINIPIGFRSNLGEKDRLEAEAYVAKQRYVQLTRALEEQVRSVWREIDHGKRRLEAAAQGVDAAQEQVRIGLIEFHNGRTTAFELVRLGADLAVAQQRYSEALVRTAKAAATLKSLTSGKYSATM
jgi:outer membrane protein TolC